jgi:Ala-tRNA(Pro) deacylase
MMFNKLNELLRQEGARFRVIHHPAEGSSEKVAEIRGTLPGQGAKAMLCHVKELPEVFVLAVLSGNRKVDFRKLGQAVGGKKATLVSSDAATKLTGCVMGAVPPFSFWPNVKLVVDPKLLDDHQEIAFNAGQLDTSIVLNSQDYKRIAAPLITAITVD